MIKKHSRVELGCAGHLVVASKCMWRRHTQVGRYRISTLGDYYPGGHRRHGERETIGSGERDFFESMVFPTTDDPDAGNDGCGCLAVASWSEIECTRYATAGEAQAGHEALIAKYAAIVAQESLAHA